MKVILAIMDGYGLRKADQYNAVTLANTPNLHRIFNAFPTATLKTSGLDVGLPEGQMGNSEVGHLNIGAGRIVYQDITRIDQSIRTGEFFKSPPLINLINDLKSSQGNLHVFGLVSDGGIHSSIEHLYAFFQLCNQQNFSKIILHAFTDGRDTSPKSGIHFVLEVENRMNELGVGAIGTVIGRYYAMDRDKRWDRVEKAYRAICHGEGKKFNSPQEAIQASYDSGITDEFILPCVIDGKTKYKPLSPNDGVFFSNFRSDRTRQLTNAITDSSFNNFTTDVKVTNYVTMTRYHESYEFPIVSLPQHLTHILGDCVSQAGLKQLRMAETEKYPHVTFFFNGGEERPFSLEDRVMIPSPKVATYDLQPEMSEPELTKKLCEEILSDQYDLIIVNYANCDMVGHTGVVEAVVKAVEATDHGVGEMWNAAQKMGYAILLTADHGNAETLWDEATHGPHTAHTTNPVPIVLLMSESKYKLRDGGRLADLAPTILELLGISQPKEMTGESLITH